MQLILRPHNYASPTWYSCIFPACADAAAEPPAEIGRRRRMWSGLEHVHNRIRQEVREKVLFTLHNVMRDLSFSRPDFITGSSCRQLKKIGRFYRTRQDPRRCGPRPC
jgi:hypothetical protein